MSRKRKKTKMHQRKKSSGAGRLLALVVIIAAAAGGGVYGLYRSTRNVVAREDENSFVLKHPDADAYYRKNSDVKRETPVEDSPYVHTESEAVQQLQGRGFTDYPVTYEYALDGTLGEEQEADPGSDEKHPIYTTYYQTSGGEVWTIMDVESIIMAYPVTYNMQNEDESAPLILSESDRVDSYDSVTGKFYESVPNGDVMKVQKVSRVDAETLESYQFS